MKAHFSVTVDNLRKVYALPHTWTASQYESLLHQLDFYDTSGLTEIELEEMAVMALQDMEEPDEAAYKVLKVAFGDSASKGLFHQLVHELQEERPWEEHSDMARHVQIFMAAGILHRAFPDMYPMPDIAQLTLDIVPCNGVAKEMLKEQPRAAFIARLLAGGMGDHSTLQRLFEVQIEGEHFPEAEFVIWQIEADLSNNRDSHPGRTFVVYTPWSWIAPLKSVKHFEASAHPDIVDKRMHELVLA